MEQKEGKNGYVKGSLTEKTKIDLDQYNFKNSDVMKWTEKKASKHTATNPSSISGFSTMSTRSKFRKR